MKQTAVEWLVHKLKSQGLLIGEPDNLVAVNQAKEMEKEQIVDAFNQSWHDRMNPYKTAEKYYNETFKSE